MAQLNIQEISVKFEDLLAMSKLSFFANFLEITGLMGHSGVGKTTVFNISTGFYMTSKVCGEASKY